MAERVGFEPTVRCRITGFQDQLLKPLGHLSKNVYNYSKKKALRQRPGGKDTKLVPTPWVGIGQSAKCKLVYA